MKKRKKRSRRERLALYEKQLRRVIALQKRILRYERELSRYIELPYT